MLYYVKVEFDEINIIRKETKEVIIGIKNIIYCEQNKEIEY